MTTKRRAEPSFAAGAPSGEGAGMTGHRTLRRRQQTRARLLEAALRLFAARGVEGVSINEITEAADLGFGTFYNYFESKEAVHAALQEMLFGRLARLFDLVLAQESDPAAIVSHSIRYVILYAGHEPLWARLLIQASANGELLNQHLGQHLFRDIRKGLDSGRFSSADPLVTFFAVGGTVLTAISAILLGEEEVEKRLGKLAAERLTLAQVDVRTANATLLLLGLTVEEAGRIAAAPLPPLAGLGTATI